MREGIIENPVYLEHLSLDTIAPVLDTAQNLATKAVLVFLFNKIRAGIKTWRNNRDSMGLSLEDIRRVSQIQFVVGVKDSGRQVSDTYVHSACAATPEGNQKSEIAFDTTDKKLKCKHCRKLLNKETAAYVTKIADNL